MKTSVLLTATSAALMVTAQSPIAAEGHEYVGCFEIINNNFQTIPFFKPFEPQECQSACWNMNSMGIAAIKGSQCQCGQLFGEQNFKLAGDAICDRICFEGSDAICGGDGVFSIYRRVSSDPRPNNGNWNANNPNGQWPGQAPGNAGGDNDGNNGPMNPNGPTNPNVPLPGQQLPGSWNPINPSPDGQWLGQASGNVGGDNDNNGPMNPNGPSKQNGNDGGDWTPPIGAVRGGGNTFQFGSNWANM